MPQICIIKGCSERAVFRGFCQLHYLKHSYSTIKLMKRPSEVPDLMDADETETDGLNPDPKRRPA